ncbi:MAG: hypothetical protein AAB592_00075 [Patescibacteria group bacterium]
MQESHDGKAGDGLPEILSAEVDHETPPGDGGITPDDRALRVGYHSLLGEEHPINDDLGACFNKERAFVFDIERRVMEIPENLRFEKLELDVYAVHRERISAVWSKVVKNYRRLHLISARLKYKWLNAPKTKDTVAAEAVRNTRTSVQKALRPAAIAIISDPDLEGENDTLDNIKALARRITFQRKPPLDAWQIEESALRREYYIADKEYIMTLRLYYELLLETQPVEAEQSPALDANAVKTVQPARQPVLSSDHPSRWDIVLRKRYLESIDVAQQGIAVAKAFHNEQNRGRIRKTGDPYIFHPLDVMTGTMLDVLPFVIEQEKLPMSLVVLIACAATHDLPEDTTWTPEEVISKLRAMVDRYDSSLDPVIVSGFGLDRIKLKGRVLNLVKKNAEGKMKRILKVLSKKTKLEIPNIKAAMPQNLFGPIDTMTLFNEGGGFRVPKEFSDGAWLARYRAVSQTSQTGANSLVLATAPYKGFGIKELDAPSAMHAKFPDSHDKKLDMLLIRLCALTDKADRQAALIIKCEDRAHNLSQMESRNTDYQLKTLRTTVTRIIAYAMLDHDQKNYPLYNALPRLIDTTVTAYQEFEKAYPLLLTDTDRRYMEQLNEWQRDVKRFTLPDHVQSMLNEYEKLKSAR